MKKLLFIINPKAGVKKNKHFVDDALEIFERAGYKVGVKYTKKRADGTRIARDYGAKADLIVCMGGDGTLNEVMQGMLEGEISTPLGYIPAGSTNDFAKSLGIPKDMVKAAKLISNDNSFLCDVGVMNERFFNYVAAFGAFTDVSYKTPQSMKNVLGHQAYIVESLKSLSKIKAYNMKVTCNDITITGNYIYGMVANSKSVGGMKGITGKNILLDDGLFEVILVREAKNPLELQQIVAGLFSKNQDSPMVDRFKASKVIFESDKSISWTLDGEYADDHQLVEIDVCPKAINIIKG